MNWIFETRRLCFRGVHYSRVPLHVQVNWTFQGKLLCLTGVHHSREAITVRNGFGHSWLLLLCLRGVFIAVTSLLPEMNSVIRDVTPVPQGCFASGVFIIAVRLLLPEVNSVIHSLTPVPHGWLPCITFDDVDALHDISLVGVRTFWEDAHGHIFADLPHDSAFAAEFKFFTKFGKFTQGFGEVIFQY